MNTMTNEQYEANAAARFRAEIAAVQTAPLSDRRHAATEWALALRDPQLILERIGWLIDGSYGYGSYRAARDVIHNPRMNRAAWLGTTIAALEWRTDRTMAAREFRNLPADVRQSLNAEIEAMCNEEAAEIVAEVTA